MSQARPRAVAARLQVLLRFLSVAFAVIGPPPRLAGAGRVDRHAPDAFVPQAEPYICGSENVSNRACRGTPAGSCSNTETPIEV